jgi:aspartate racemase
VKTIGLLGGMSWESTLVYYRLLNERVKERLGGLHSAKIILYSVDFQEIEELQSAGRWDEAGERLASAATAVARAGADFLVICTNTMHKVAGEIERASGLTVLQIADATADAVLRAGISKVGLLGTRFTMEQDFYRGRLEARGLDVVVPADDDRAFVHRVIYDELCLGRIVDASKTGFDAIIANLVRTGAEGVILGCTEIGILVGEGSATVPLFDTTVIHARAAADFAMGA